MLVMAVMEPECANVALCRIETREGEEDVDVLELACESVDVCEAGGEEGEGEGVSSQRNSE